MRKTINISVYEEMFRYIHEQRGLATVSEYIRSLISRERRRSLEQASRPPARLRSANDAMFVGQALEQVEKLRAILEGKEGQ